MQMTKWTGPQRKAIEARGEAIVVSAAAGSGKTTVLIQRIIEMVINKECTIDRMLIVTFTRAATAEIRSRLATAITDALKKDPDNTELIKQQMLVPSAHIYTMDAFCSNFVRENFETLGLTPDFKVLDEGMAPIYIAEALNNTLDKYFSEDSEEFRQLRMLLTEKGYKSTTLEKTIKEIYEKSRAYADPQAALKNALSYYEYDGPVEDSPAVKAFVTYFLDYTDYLIDGIKHGMEFFESDPEILTNSNCEHNYSVLKTELPIYEDFRDAVSRADFEKAFSLKDTFRFGSWQVSKYNGTDFDFYATQQYREALKKLMKGEKDPFSTDCITWTHFLEKDIKTGLPLLKTLIKAVNDFEAEYKKLKSDKNLIDFSDMQHYAYDLLYNKDGSKSDKAKDLAESFDQILIDEYQDTTDLQDKIFSAVSRDEKNLFIVGDIKQSIYGFRNAMPELFLYKKENYPRSLHLGENFRSTYGIIDYVNFVFSQVMTKTCGDIDYRNEDEKLIYGGEEKDKDLNRGDVELHVFGDSPYHVAQKESAFVAKFITERMAEDENLSYSDFAILLRKTAYGVGQTYAATLSDANIPVLFAGDEDFFETADTRIVLSLLHVIDNPVQDIHLLAVLMSPIFNFSADKVAAIRAKGKNKDHSLYANLLSEEKDDEEVKKVLDTIRLYRQLSVAMPVGELIRKIYDDTLLPSIVASMPNGISRQANLMLLSDYADGYEQNTEIGIGSFVRFLDSLLENDLSLKTASLTAGKTDAVKIMTIHKSKGLQFKYCIVPGLNTAFKNESHNIQFGHDMVMGIKALDKETGDLLPSFINELMKIERSRIETAEALRVLYVAMTRAKEKLILIGSTNLAKASNMKNFIPDLRENNTLYPQMIMNAKDPLQILLAATFHHTNASPLLHETDIKYPTITTETPIYCEVHHDPEETEQEIETEQLSTAVDKDMLEELKKRMEYEYPYLALATVPTKRSASATEAAGFDARYFATAIPEFMLQRGLTAAQIGTCLHRFMQFADFENAKTDPGKEVERLTDLGYFTENEALTIDTDKIKSFFKSDIYARMEKSPNVMREKKFAVLVPASRFNPDLPPELAKETVLIQGIADCVFVEDDKLVIVDYKTDRTTVEEELINRHKAQLMTYAEALSQVLGMEVKAAYVYAFSLDKEIKVI